MASLSNATTIHSLPNEIIAHIFSHLDSPAPSSTRLHDQPSSSMLKSQFQPLKSVSLVCKLFRSTVLPHLFRHVLWHFDRWELLLLGEETSDHSSLAERIDLLSFLTANELCRSVKTLTLLVRDSMVDVFLPGTRQGSAGSAGSSRRVRMAEAAAGTTGNAATTYNEDNNWMWRLLFEHLNPERFTLIASPKMLASLLSRMLFLRDAWSFTQSLHILSLATKEASDHRTWEDDEDSDEAELQSAQSSTTTNMPPEPPPVPGQRPRVPCDLFTIRPWHSVTLNEGSSIRAYQTYDWFLRRPPSMLGALLGSEEHPNDAPLLPARTVRDLNYVAIFPLSAHFQSLVQHLPPGLDRLFVQLVPRNEVLRDAEAMRNIDAGDLWMERNTAYSMLMSQLLAREPAAPWRRLREFESGDAADAEAWAMAVEYVRLSGPEWRVEREGVFVRGRPPGRAAADGEGGEGADGADGHVADGGFVPQWNDD